MLQEPDIRSTYTNIPIDNKSPDYDLHFAMTGGRGDYEYEHAESNRYDAILTAWPRQLAMIDLVVDELGTSDVKG